MTFVKRTRKTNIAFVLVISPIDNIYKTDCTRTRLTTYTFPKKKNINNLSVLF